MYLPPGVNCLSDELKPQQYFPKATRQLHYFQLKMTISPFPCFLNATICRAGVWRQVSLRHYDKLAVYCMYLTGNNLYLTMTYKYSILFYFILFYFFFAALQKLQDKMANTFSCFLTLSTFSESTYYKSSNPASVI